MVIDVGGFVVLLEVGLSCVCVFGMCVFVDDDEKRRRLGKWEERGIL